MIFTIACACWDKIIFIIKNITSNWKNFFDRNENDFKRYLFNLFKKIPNRDNSENDFWLLAKFISQGFLEFHNKVLELEKMNDDNKLIVVEIHSNFENFDFYHYNSGVEVNVFGKSVNAIYII